MDWTAVATILATGVVTTAGVIAKGVYDTRAARERLDAEERRSLAAQAREDGAADAKRSAAAGRERVQTGQTALAVFTEMLAMMQSYPSVITTDVVQQNWRKHFDARARQTIEMLGDDSARATMADTLDALANFGPYSRVNELSRQGTWNAEWLIKIVVSLAGCIARGTQPDGDLQERVKLMRERVNAMRDEYE